MMDIFSGIPEFANLNVVPAHTATGGSTPPADASTPQTPVVSAGSFLKWLIAIGALWAILIALHEYGGTAQDIGTGFALLIVVTALLVLGPKAMQNLTGAL